MPLAQPSFSSPSAKVASNDAPDGEPDHLSAVASAAAFAASRDICRHHARSFYFASIFLPKAKRQAAYAVYAFCRLLDDAVDREGDDGRRLEQLMTCLDPLDNGRDFARFPLPIQAFVATVHQYRLPRRLFLDLAQGCRMDLTINRYATWADLENYCYHVAGVVGLIMSPILGLRDPAAEQDAVTMGNAMQLTNILRDVKEDWGRGRLYLPADDLAKFGYSEADLTANVVNDNFRALMQFEVDRARGMFRQGARGLCHLADDGSRFTACAMAVIYSGILTQIERRRGDVLSGRAATSTLQKVCRLPAAWRLSRRRPDQPVPDVF